MRLHSREVCLHLQLCVQKQGELWRRVSIHTTFDTTLGELQTGHREEGLAKVWRKLERAPATFGMGGGEEGGEL